MKRNIISLSTLHKEGLKYTSSGGVVKVSKGSLVYLLGDLNASNLYVLRGSIVYGSIAAAAAVTNSEPSKTDF